jgi:Tfp pilus assembly protein PilN
MQPVLPLLMKLNPAYYQFNWQQQNEQRQIGLLAQEAYQLFPELVSYSKEKDLYKMNYAGFSTVAIKAIQEQQQQIEELENKNEALKARLEKLEAAVLK